MWGEREVTGAEDRLETSFLHSTLFNTCPEPPSYGGYVFSLSEGGALWPVTPRPAWMVDGGGTREQFSSRLSSLPTLFMERVSARLRLAAT